MRLSALSTLLAFFLALLGDAGAAQDARWSQLTDTLFRHLGTDHGLPNTIATALAQDHEGFIWIGTQGGLARWDGYRFKTYRPPSNQDSSLPSLFVQTLHVDGLGRLWVGTNGGLARYEVATDTFTTYGPGDNNGLSHPTVLSVAEDGAGGLWIATVGGLDHLDLARGSIRTAKQSANHGLPSGRISSVVRDPAGQLWVGTQTGLWVREAGRNSFTSVALPLPTGQAATVERLVRDAQGNLWIGTRRNGAFRRDAGSGQITQVAETGSRGDDFLSANVSSIVEVLPGVVWIGTFGAGIVEVQVASGATRRIQRDRSLPRTLSDNSVWALLRDRSGLVWAGTNLGVSFHNPAQTALATVFGASSRSDGLTDTEIFGMAQAPDGTLWLGLGRNGIDIMHPAQARVGALRPGADPARSLPQDRVWSIAAAPDRRMFIGTNRGLYQADTHTRAVERMAVAGRSPVESTQAVLLEGRTLYFGGSAGGLWQMDTLRHTVRPMEAAALAGQPIVTLGKAQGSGSACAASLWVATATNLVGLPTGPDGLAMADKARALARNDADAAKLGLTGITSLLCDRMGRLWVATDVGDLQFIRFDDPGHSPQHHRVQRESPDEVAARGIGKLLEDAQGNIWASTDGGLVRIDARSHAERSHGHADGDAFTTGYWADSGLATAEGELVFGALGGITVVHPQHAAPWAFQPPVAITELRVGDHAIVSPQRQGTDLSTVVIPADTNRLAVEFSALDFSAPELNRYAYRMDGVDTDWIASDPTRRLASYANLAPGDYTLRLRGSNRNGQWAAADLALPIRVLPAWYQTGLFRFALLLLAMATVYGIVAVRTAALRRRQHALELKVQERTAQLETASRALEEISLTDPLTGLRNRRFAMQHLDSDAGASVRSHEGTEGAVAQNDSDLVFYLIDIDHFKQVNDVYGHGGGDAVLTQLPQRLKAVFRDTDYLVRWGGEEFLVVARRTSRSSGADRAERIRQSVAQTAFELPGGISLHKTCSIGFAAFPFAPATPRAVAWGDVIELADAALYAAKRSGRNGWVGLRARDRAMADGFAHRFKANPGVVVAAGELEIESSLPLTDVRAGLGS